MSANRLSYRYAKSLLDLAIERNAVATVSDNINTLQNALNNSRELLVLMKSPIINADKKTAVINKLFGNHFDAITKGFLDIVIRKHREAYLPEIVSAFIVQHKELDGVVTAKLTTAVPVNDQIIDKVKNLVLRQTGKKAVDLTTKVDPFVIGGFILEYDDKLFDASIQQKLQDLELAFQENKYVRKF
jgi:F-type H+-transporting ATPase subunit delta